MQRLLPLLRCGALQLSGEIVGEHRRTQIEWVGAPGVGRDVVQGIASLELGEDRLLSTAPIVTLEQHPVVYCLRSSETDWDEQRLWCTYIMLTDLEAVFRSLKSELGLRPVYHHTAERADGHLFITVLAYQFVQILRRQLKHHGVDARWQSLRQWLGGQVRVTATFRRADGRALHVRKVTRPDGEHLRICRLLGIDTQPGAIEKQVH